MEVENSYLLLEQKIETVKTKHPLLYTIWKHYLKLKKKEFDRLNTQLKDMVELIDSNENIPEITLEQLQFIYCMNMLHN